MQFGFMLGKGTTDATFIMQHVQEKHQARNEMCTMLLWIWRRHLIESERGDETCFEEAGCG